MLTSSTNTMGSEAQKSSAQSLVDVFKAPTRLSLSRKHTIELGIHHLENENFEEAPVMTSRVLNTLSV